MTVSKEASVDLHEKFTKILKLITEDSKLDPENEPYKSKYSAREILIGMKASLENLLESENEPKQTRKFTAMLGSVYLYLGIVSIDTEELTQGEEYLEMCNKTIKDNPEDFDFVIITLTMYNQFGILYSLRDAEKAKNYLEKSEALYQKFKTTSPDPPLDIPDLFSPDLSVENQNPDQAWISYEKTHTLTLYFLAQIYGVLKDTFKSSIYCHNTLKRQLKSKDYDSIDWALNSATLSQFFMEKNGFKQARHHLAASSFILDKYELELNKINDDSESFAAKYETFKHRSADVARCWAKYGLLLLAKSKERLLAKAEERDIDDVCFDCETPLEFDDLDLASYESQVTFKYILTIQDARVVFLNIQTWLRKAENYYTLENLASDHVEIVQDQSQMYYNLLFFEESVDNQAKLHKRRVDLLENVIKKINPQFYLNYCRQIWFELGQVYSEIFNIKSDKLKESAERPSPHALAKINHLVERSIANFTAFVESFEDCNSPVSEEFEKVYLQAWFHVAALSSRFITLDKGVQLRNVEKSLAAYEKVVEYCKKYERAKEGFGMELNICEEMARMLPVKVAKLRLEAFSM